MLPSLLLGFVLLASPALAWSAVGASGLAPPTSQATGLIPLPPPPSDLLTGHEIVATIAQAHLTPRTLQAVKEILPQETNGHLASIASWAVCHLVSTAPVVLTVG